MPRRIAGGWAAQGAAAGTRAAGPTPWYSPIPTPNSTACRSGFQRASSRKVKNMASGGVLPVDPRHFRLYLVSMSSQQAKYRPPPPSGALELAPDCLMFAIDDTGHERLKGQSIYGLGGCAVMGRDYYRVISDPWTRRRAATTGDFGGRLRAAEFGRRATPANMAAMGRFFANQSSGQGGGRRSVFRFPLLRYRCPLAYLPERGREAGQRCGTLERHSLSDNQ